MRYRIFLAMFAGAVSLATVQAVQAAQAVRIDDAWVRATVPGQRATGAFMRLSAQGPLRLVAAASAAAGRVELHEMRMEGDVMRMRPVAGIPLEPGKALLLAPGGYHIMLLDLVRQARAGERIPLSLRFERPDGTSFGIDVEAAVRPLGTQPAGH